jgi:hypothetical protein
MARLSHLTRRFFGSLRPGGPSTVDQTWAEAQLLPGEQAIWCRLSGPDRRHSAAVAREVELILGPSAARPVLAAALLHDCGKVESGLRTPGRVVATVLGATVVRTPEEVSRWATSNSRVRRSIGQYRLHPEIGAEMLVAAGSDSLTVAWAREHHQPESSWTIDLNVAAALHAADDD